MATADGTEKVITVTMHGTNDAAVITGTSTAELTETNAAQTHRRRPECHRRGQLGRLRGADQRGRQQRLRQVLDRRDRCLDLHDGQTPTTSSWAGIDYTDSITVATADGTEQVITVTMHGTNDAAVITGSSTAALTETNAAQSTGGDLNATDVDSSATFVAQSDVAGSNGYGKFSIDAAGTWTYTMDNAHDEFVGGHRLHRQHHGGDGRRH